MSSELSEFIGRMREHPELDEEFAEAESVAREYAQILEALGDDEPVTDHSTNTANITISIEASEDTSTV